jgi:hypothetical protein
MGNFNACVLVIIEAFISIALHRSNAFHELCM